MNLDTALDTAAEAPASTRGAKAAKQREWVDYTGEMTISKYRALRVVYRAIGVGAIGMGILGYMLPGCRAPCSS